MKVADTSKRLPIYNADIEDDIGPVVAFLVILERFIMERAVSNPCPTDPEPPK